MRSLLITLSLLACLLAGCTPGGAKGRVVVATQEVDKLVDGAREDLAEAVTLVEVGQDPIPPIKAADEKLVKVKGQTARARIQVTATENKTDPRWEIIGRIAWIAGIALVVGGAIYFGVGKIVRPILARAGMWISSRTRAEASRAEKAIRTGDVAPVREMVFAKRSGDPAFDRAYADEEAKHPAPPVSPASGVPSAATASSG